MEGANRGEEDVSGVCVGEDVGLIESVDVNGDGR